MRDADCIALLRWALPRAGLRWEGVRRPRRQVCRRIAERMRALGLDGVAAYRQRLEAVPEEWAEFDALCRVTISRFFRDRAVFDRLGADVLPRLAAAAARRDGVLRCWSAGCASGEEPYSLALLWSLRASAACPGVSLAIVATDADEGMLARAGRACYPRGALRDLPRDWAERAFTAEAGQHCLEEEYRRGIVFRRQDLRADWPAGPFDLVLCRNLAFTYFAAEVQARVLAELLARLRSGGALVVGKKEAVPACPALEASPAGLGIYWKT